MSKFKTIASLIKGKRVNIFMSQVKLSRSIGYKNGQFISNVERGLCSIPHNKIRVISMVLNMRHTDIIDACIEDYERNIRNEVYYQCANNNIETTTKENRNAN